MSDAFDPYHQWLGIPRSNRPPSDRDLVGVEEGETDPDRIKDAAAERIEEIRELTLGPEREHASRLLTETSEALVSLLKVGVTDVVETEKLPPLADVTPQPDQSVASPEAAARSIEEQREDAAEVNLAPTPVPAKPPTTQLAPNVLPTITSNAISPATGQVSLAPTGQANLPSNVIKPDVELTRGAQSLVQNLAKKDQILKLKKDFPAIQEKIVLGKPPALQKARAYAQESLFLGPKCAWWVPWYYHCYWHDCHHWCWDYWYPCHFHVIHCYAVSTATTSEPSCLPFRASAWGGGHQAGLAGRAGGAGGRRHDRRRQRPSAANARQ